MDDIELRYFALGYDMLNGNQSFYLENCNIEIFKNFSNFVLKYEI